MPNLIDSTSPHEPHFVIQPENFRRVVQKQIEAHVAKQVDGITRFTPGYAINNDGRFSNGRPSQKIYMSNSQGFNYFIVGSSVVGGINVVGP